MKKIFPLLFLTFFSCLSKETAPPIPIPQIAQILKEIHLAQAYTNTQKNLNPTQQDSLRNAQYNQILKKNNLTHEQLQTHLQHFYDHPQQLDSVYSLILTELSIEITKHNPSPKHTPRKTP